MRACARDHGKSVSQRAVSQETTKYKWSTPSLNMYQSDKPIGERIQFETSSSVNLHNSDENQLLETSGQWLSTLRAESPSIFLEKLGRGRRLCSRPAHSLIRRSSKKMDESVQFRTGHTGLPLVRMLNRKNCWLFRAHGILFTIDHDRQAWRLLRFRTKSLENPCYHKS